MKFGELSKLAVTSLNAYDPDKIDDWRRLRQLFGPDVTCATITFGQPCELGFGKGRRLGGPVDLEATLTCELDGKVSWSVLCIPAFFHGRYEQGRVVIDKVTLSLFCEPIGTAH